jgi:flagellar biosynthesis GTPase FlhF
MDEFDRSMFEDWWEEQAKEKQEEERRKNETEEQRKKREEEEHAKKYKVIIERREEKRRQIEERKRKREEEERKREEEERYREEIERLKESGVLGWKFVIYLHNYDFKDDEHILFDIRKFCEKYDNSYFETKNRRLYTFYTDYPTMIMFLDHFIEKTFYNSVKKQWEPDVYYYEILELHPIQITTEKVIFYPYNKEKHYIIESIEWDNLNDYYISSNYNEDDEEIIFVYKSIPYLHIINDENYIELFEYVFSNGKEDEYVNLEEQLKKYKKRCV